MLAGAHLLTIPHLYKKDKTLTCQNDWQYYRFARLLGYSAKAAKTCNGWEDLMNDYLGRRGIGRRAAPLSYGLSISNYENIMMEGCDSTLKTSEQTSYLGLFFIGNTFTDDYGGELETIERLHPGLGSWLLQEIDRSPCNILTPLDIYDEPECFLNWEWSKEANDYCYSSCEGFDDDAITPEMFREYYPEWAFTRFDDPVPDLAPWPELAKLERLRKEFYRIHGSFDERDRFFIIPDGADMYGGVIAWTRGRNDVEEDIAYRVCNDYYEQMNYACGAVPGCMQFEFILDDANEARNCRMLKLLDSFCRYLVVFDTIMDGIEGGAFR